MGAGTEREHENVYARPPVTAIGRGSYRGRGGHGATPRRSAPTAMERCLVCEEQVSKETMVFHLIRPQTFPGEGPTSSSSFHSNVLTVTTSMNSR